MATTADDAIGRHLLTFSVNSVVHREFELHIPAKVKRRNYRCRTYVMMLRCFKSDQFTVNGSSLKTKCLFLLVLIYTDNNPTSLMHTIELASIPILESQQVSTSAFVNMRFGSLLARSIDTIAENHSHRETSLCRSAMILALLGFVLCRTSVSGAIPSCVQKRSDCGKARISASITFSDDPKQHAMCRGK